MAAALLGVLAAQVALAMPAAGPAPHDVPVHDLPSHDLPPRDVVHLTTEPGDPPPVSMPCDDTGPCDWGLMTCEAGSCAPVPAVAGTPVAGQAAPPAVRPDAVRRATPDVRFLPVESPPPRA